MINFFKFLRLKLQKKNKTTQELFLLYCQETPWAAECRIYDL